MDRPYYVQIAISNHEESELFGEEGGSKKVIHSTELKFSFDELGQLKSFIQKLRKKQDHEEAVRCRKRRC